MSQVIHHLTLNAQFLYKNIFQDQVGAASSGFPDYLNQPSSTTLIL